MRYRITYEISKYRVCVVNADSHDEAIEKFDRGDWEFDSDKYGDMFDAEICDVELVKTEAQPCD